MNNYYFSPSTISFYPEGISDLYKEAGTLPADITLVTDEAFAIYSGVPPEGKKRGVSDDGLPVWIEIPPLSHVEQVEVANADKQSRIDQTNDYINGKHWPGKAALGRLSDAEKSQYSSWLDYLDALEAIDTASAPDISWPDSPAA
ncbi:TPA: tail fiber assembly protein [Klebsiella quasipneumoniae]|uniref:tail fiber assembly protein n=1 Tax=Escherichia coli TaxID=562 RepID=UPI0017692B61|nr:tail fiber assembly protein [Escherichia coli]